MLRSRAVAGGFAILLASCAVATQGALDTGLDSEQ